MKFLIITTFFAIIHAVSCTESNRQGKLFSLFSIVSFKNNICNGTTITATDNPNCVPQGICYSKAECDNKGGTDLGNCAQGFGVCCQVTGSTSTSETIAAFTNPDYPLSTKGTGTYKYDITVDNQDICQIRLDICELKMAGPNTDVADIPNNGKCDTESLEITANADLFLDTTLGITPLCGSSKYNTNQHIYIGDFTTSGEKVVTITAQTAGTGAKWFVKTSLVDCTERSGFVSNLRAPQGCRQYYTENTGTINSFNFGGDGAVKYWYPQNYKICIKRDPLNECEIRLDRTPELSAYTVSIGLSAMSADILGPYGGCEYTAVAGPVTGPSQFWGCGVPGKNAGLTTLMEKFTTDTGCGNFLVDFGGCFDPNPTGNPAVVNNQLCRRNSVAIADYLNIQQGKFIRGCIHNTDCTTTDNTPHYVENDYYCGAGIGGDTPACSDPTMATLTTCTSYTGFIAPDGKSGTTTTKTTGLTTSNTGVYQQLGGSASDHFSMVFNVLDTSDQDGLAQGNANRLGFGLTYEKNAKCTVFKNADESTPLYNRRKPASNTNSGNIYTSQETSQGAQISQDSELYKTIFRILQGQFMNTEGNSPISMPAPTEEDTERVEETTPQNRRRWSSRRNRFQNPPRYQDMYH